MDPRDLALTAARAVAVYAVMLAIIRFSGKRTIGMFSAFDFLVAIMLGEVVDEIIYGSVSMAQGFVGLGVIALLHYGNSWLTYWDHGFGRLLEGSPTVVLEKGQLHYPGMRAERMNEKDVLSELRLRGVDDLREVKVAVIEYNGELSVIRQDWAEPVQKADVGLAMEEQRRADTGGDDTPMPEHRTDSPQHLGRSE
ncbi:MAG TPA: YetF domain-containing protein [Gemmatimonadaceae bacterium]|nr:YetF domain-containing protein [Gemmatimonadaceae bacterium]